MYLNISFFPTNNDFYLYCKPYSLPVYKRASMHISPRGRRSRDGGGGNRPAPTSRASRQYLFAGAEVNTDRSLRPPDAYYCHWRANSDNVNGLVMDCDTTRRAARRGARRGASHADGARAESQLCPCREPVPPGRVPQLCGAGCAAAAPGWAPNHVPHLWSRDLLLSSRSVI